VEFRTRIVPGVLIGGVVLAGGGAVVAASGGSSSQSSAASTEYCPDGTPKPPSGECPGKNGHPGGPPEKPGKHKKHKKPKFKVRPHGARKCWSRSYVASIGVANKPAKGRVSIYRDGHKISSTARRSFTVRINLRHLKPGVHKITLRVRGADGKIYKRTIHFRSC
jgi:E-set like domain